MEEQCLLRGEGNSVRGLSEGFDLFLLPSVKMVVEDPVFNQDDKYFLSDEEAFDSAMKKSIHYIEALKSGKLSGRPDAFYFRT